MTWTNESQAADIIATIEANPLFATLVEATVLRPYQKWAAAQSDLEGSSPSPGSS